MTAAKRCVTCARAIYGKSWFQTNNGNYFCDMDCMNEQTKSHNRHSKVFNITQTVEVAPIAENN